MKKIVILSMFAFATLTSVNLTAQTNLSTSNNLSSIESAGTGKILIVDNSSTKGVLIDNETGAMEEFINPSREVIVIGDRFEFLRIIQSTPNGEKVIIILKNKLPL